MATSTWHYRHHPRARVADPIAHTERYQPCALSSEERAQIVSAIRDGWHEQRSVEQSFYDAFDAGRPVASLSTWMRCARGLHGPRPVRRRRTRRTVAMPQWEASAPNEVWCWDITKLPGPYTGVWYQQYTIIDAFSRTIIASSVETDESDELAVALFQAATEREGVHPRIVHSDGGPAMKSVLLADFYRHAGISASRNRPRVSNDNPHIESYFKTEKYRPDYPSQFTSVEHAREWAEHVVHDYNTRHHHSSLAGFTPEQVHTGTWVDVHTERQAVLDAQYAANPERYRGRRPIAATTPEITQLHPT